MAAISDLTQNPLRPEYSEVTAGLGSRSFTAFDWLAAGKEISFFQFSRTGLISAEVCY